MKYGSFPRKIMIQTTSACNGLCDFCPHPHVRYSLPQGYMKDALYDKILSECAINHEKIDSIMPYLMNEPLLDFYLLEKIKKTKELLPKVSMHILTNGLLLKDRLANQIIDSPLDWIGISFFGLNKKNYEKYTGLPFDISRNRIETFIKKALKKRGEEFLLVTFFKWGDISAIDADETKNYLHSLGIKRISFYEKGISRAGNVSRIKHFQKKTMRKCNSIWTNHMIHILYNGDVVLCCMDWRRKHILGNVKENSIEEIWCSQNYIKVRDVTSGHIPLAETNFICQRCEMAL